MKPVSTEEEEVRDKGESYLVGIHGWWDESWERERERERLSEI